MYPPTPPPPEVRTTSYRFTQVCPLLYLPVCLLTVIVCVRLASVVLSSFCFGRSVCILLSSFCLHFTFVVLSSLSFGRSVSILLSSFCLHFTLVVLSSFYFGRFFILLSSFCLHFTFVVPSFYFGHSAFILLWSFCFHFALVVVSVGAGIYVVDAVAVTVLFVDAIVVAVLLLFLLSPQRRRQNTAQVSKGEKDRSSEPSWPSMMTSQGVKMKVTSHLTCLPSAARCLKR